MFFYELNVYLQLVTCFTLSYASPVPEAPFGGYSPPSSSYGAPAPAPVYGAPAQPPVIHKHVYVHVPPPEPEYVAPRKPIPVAAPQKHYKIVFIKVRLNFFCIVQHTYIQLV